MHPVTTSPVEPRKSLMTWKVTTSERQILRDAAAARGLSQAQLIRLALAAQGVKLSA